ncbi:hypothetical protein Nepgr_012842 [Nepenthes gracilis]|uniref:F-box domain-containing protein n=1 Tax=Nepenthes gracilis TaxID=150966 RepID=A0AAD3SHU6_NEPGR|nr:hypothetical protein Nepgr_012842 [Nepenthes gracilis]
METRSTRMPGLPCSIVIDILGRLPMKTLSQCRYVCKAWRSMLTENYFYKLYAAHTPTTLILQIKGSISSLRDIYLIEAADDCSITSCYLSISEKCCAEVPNFRYQLGNSCNGLICLRELRSREPVAIWNPIMGQYSILPEPTSISDDKVVAGFGFCSRTNRYKVLRVFHEKQAPASKWATEIHDFGVDRKWRRIGDAPYAIPSLIPGFYINNSLHWIVDYASSTSCDELICSFDFVNENFTSIPQPPIFSFDQRNKYHWSNLGILRGCLSICAIDARVFRPDVQVWVMEEYGVPESWVKKLSIRDPAVDWWDPYRWIQVTNFLKNGKILILCGHRYLLEYDPHGRSFQSLRSLDFPAIAHVPCFVSLKDVFRGDGALPINVAYM